MPLATGCRPFLLHGPPQALDEDVVVAAPASTHADLDPVIPQHRGELVAGELGTLIGIEDARLAEPSEGLAQCLDADPAFSVFDSRQDSTRRVAQSIIPGTKTPAASLCTLRQRPTPGSAGR
jgi:hypothetical protein